MIDRRSIMLWKEQVDLLLRTGTDNFKPLKAYEMVKTAFIDKMEGKRD